MAHALLEQYAKLTEFLGHALGPDYEIALHDLTDKTHSIIAIANNHVSGREIGAPLTNIALKTLMDKTYLTEDYKLHYKGVSNSGRTLRSSTLFIKHNTKLIGMLCINFDDSRHQTVADNILKLCHPDAFVETNFQMDMSRLEGKPKQVAPIPESFYNSIDAVAADAIARELQLLGITAERLTAAERIHIISELESSGIFLLKGAVKDVADALHCSQASVYRYLSQVKNEEN